MTDPTTNAPFDPRRYAPAVARNRDAVRSALVPLLPNHGTVLEIASGSGEHAAHIAPRLSEGIQWQPTDLDPDALPGIDAHAAAINCARILPAKAVNVALGGWEEALQADAIFCANMIHIAPWEAALGLFQGASNLLSSGAGLMLYGPFRRDGQHTAPSNAEFDAFLKDRDPTWGVRDLEQDVVPAARAAHMTLAESVEMPANNLIVVFRRDR